MSDVESDISSPEWEPWDDKDDDDDDDNDTSQSENNTIDTQHHESEGNKLIHTYSVTCYFIPVVSRHGAANTRSNRWKC